MKPKFDYPYHQIRVDDLDLYYWDEGQGEPIFLIHGLAETVENWAWMYPMLTRTHRVIALNLPGFGRSPVPSSNYLARGLPGAAVIFNHFLKQLGIDHAVIVGHSLGAGMALEYALTYPANTRGLVLMSSMGFGRQIDTISRLLTLPFAGELFFHPVPFLVRNFFPTTQPVENLQTLIDLTCQYLQRPAYKRWNLAVLKQGVNLNGQVINFENRDFSKLTCPTLLIWGERDPLFPPIHGQLANRVIPNSQLHILNGVYHHPNIERAEKVSQLLLDYTAQL